jgi:hypothetical protein
MLKRYSQENLYVGYESRNHLLADLMGSNWDQIERQARLARHP